MQVRNLELPERHELRKLQQLKEEAGEMTAADERKLRGLQRATEREILQAADVVCVTCVGAGDLRLTNFRFRQVCSYCIKSQTCTGGENFCRVVAAPAGPFACCSAILDS